MLNQSTDPNLSVLGGQVKSRVCVEVLLVDVDLLGAQEVGGHLVEAVLSCQVQGRVVVVVALESREILTVCMIG